MIYLYLLLSMCTMIDYTIKYLWYDLGKSARWKKWELNDLNHLGAPGCGQNFGVSKNESTT